MRLLAGKRLIVTYSVSIDDLIILATALSVPLSKESGCLDFLEEVIFCVDERQNYDGEWRWGRNEIDTTRYVVLLSRSSDIYSKAVHIKLCPLISFVPSHPQHT